MAEGRRGLQPRTLQPSTPSPLRGAPPEGGHCGTMNAPIRVLEHVTRTAPLGVRFWDVAALVPITEGLAVSVWSRARPDRVRVLSASASGAHVLHNAPELSDVAWGEGTDAFWTGLGPRKP